MAKKPKSDNFDALGSVFDFLFTEAKKPPDKRKPIKPTGVSANDALTAAAFAALEKPGAFMSDNIVTEFNRSLDYQLGVIQFGDGEPGKLKIKSNNLISFLKDPQGTVDKALAGAKGARRAGRAAYLGEFMKDFVASGWARKYGDIEAQKAVYGVSIASKTGKPKDESYAVGRAVGQYFAGTGEGTRASSAEYEFMHNRSFELVRRKMFSDDKWSAMSESQREEFSKSFFKENSWKKVKGRETPDTSLQQFLLSNFSRDEATEMYKAYISSVGSDIKGRNIADPKKYISLEKDYLDSNIKNLQQSGPLTLEDYNRLQVYKKTKFLLEKRAGEKSLRSELERIKGEISTTSDANYRAQLKRELKDTKNALRILGSGNIAEKIGQAEGYINSWNDVYGRNGTALLASVLGGSFFDPNSNMILRPTRRLDFKDKKAGYEANIYIADKSKYGLINLHNSIGTGIYYMTPASVFKTLFVNGEGFYYLLYKNIEQRMDLADLMKGTLGKDEYTSGDLFSMYLNEDWDSFLTKYGSKFGKEDIKEFEMFFKSNKNLRSLSKVFSGPSRVKQAIQNRINSWTEPWRQRFADKFLMRFVKKYGAGPLLEQWIAKGGINVMFRSLATAIAGALGIATGPLGSLIVMAITDVATKFAMKAFAQMMIIGKYMLFGIVGLGFLIFFWASSSVKSFNRTNLSYHNETPGSIIQCTVYEETELEEGDTPWGDTIIPPPSGESCVFGAGSFGCSQGFNDVDGWTHQRTSHLMPVDLTSVGYIYAPQFCSTGNCSITRIAMINCGDGSNAGGIVELTATSGGTTYLFKLLHVKPLAGLGEKLSGGQAVAVVQESPEVEKGWCWTGKHLHLETRQNGAVVDPLKLLQSFSCGVPDESSCSRP